MAEACGVSTLYIYMYVFVHVRDDVMHFSVFFFFLTTHIRGPGVRAVHYPIFIYIRHFLLCVSHLSLPVLLFF